MIQSLRPEIIGADEIIQCPHWALYIFVCQVSIRDNALATPSVGKSQAHPFQHKVELQQFGWLERPWPLLFNPKMWLQVF